MGQQYTRLCYNDIQPLYGIRHMDQDVVPYVDDRVSPGDDPKDYEKHWGFLEYPVLTGLVMYAAAKLSDTADGFLLWNVVFLSLFAVATTFVLYRSVDDQRRIAFWALGPPLFLYAFHNWDLIAVFFSVLALHYWRRENTLGTGIALALGASAKLYPIFLAPALGVAILRRDRGLRRDGWRFGLGFAGAAALVNGPFLLANPNLFLETYRFHLRRSPNFETFWYALREYGDRWHIQAFRHGTDQQTLGASVLVLLLTGLSGICLLVWRQRLDPVWGAFASVLVFMVSNKIFSVQYALWILPFFALLDLRPIKFAAFAAADLYVYWAIFTFFAHFDHARDYYDRVAWAVLGRTLVLLWLLVDAAQGPTTPPPVRGPADPAP
jgi:uncharacterized membrane protein